MTKDDDGVWSVTVGPMAPQLWGYWFIVDGVKALDPNNGETQRDGNRYDNLLMISGPESDLWDFKDVPHGTVEQVWYPSPTLKQARRRMYVYLPPDYEDSTAKYPVLYLLHGGGGDEDAWTTMGRAHDHHGQPDRGRQGEADDRRHAERQRDADGVAGLRASARRPPRSRSWRRRRRRSRRPSRPRGQPAHGRPSRRSRTRAPTRTAS